MLPFLLIAVISLLAQLLLPWWSIALVAFVVCFWRSKTSSQAFLAGFFGIALVWQLYVSFVHIQNEGLLTGRISQLLFKADKPLALLELTVLIGGLIGGLSALSGHLCRKAFLIRQF